METLPRLVADALNARLRIMPAVVVTGIRRPVADPLNVITRGRERRL